MKRISKLWIIAGILALLALIMWLLSGNKKKRRLRLKLHQPLRLQ